MDWGMQETRLDFARRLEAFFCQALDDNIGAVIAQGESWQDPETRKLRGRTTAKFPSS